MHTGRMRTAVAVMPDIGTTNSGKMVFGLDNSALTPEPHEAQGYIVPADLNAIVVVNTIGTYYVTGMMTQALGTQEERRDTFPSQVDLGPDVRGSHHLE
jgi:hypothetical protein